MTVNLVSSVPALLAALKGCKGGESIYLAPGTYSGVHLQNLPAYSSPVTICGAPSAGTAPSRVRPKLTDLLVVASNLVIQGLELDGSAAKVDNIFSLFGSTNVVWRDLFIHGPLTGDLTNAHALSLVRSCHNVTIENCEFTRAGQFGLLGHLDNDGLTVDRCHLHDTASDCIRGGGSSNVTISNCLIENLLCLGGAHPDAMQFWTTGTKGPQSNIRIVGNTIRRGIGSGAFQGVFLGNELSHRYVGVRIADNVIEGAGITSIGVGCAQDVTITGNTCQPFIDTSTPHQPNNEIARIMVSDVTGSKVIENNKASQYGTRDKPAWAFDPSNTLLKPIPAH